MKRSLNKALFGSRTYRDEQRVDGFESPQNQRRIKPYPLASLSMLESFLSATDTGSLYTALGDVEYATDTESTNLKIGTDFAGLATQQKWLIKNIKKVFKLTNIGVHPLTLRTWEFVANTSASLISVSDSDVIQFNREMLASYDALFPTGASSVTGTSGDFILTQPTPFDEVYCASEYLGLVNREFSKKFKCVKKRMIKINPGDEILYTLKTKDFMYDPQKLLLNLGDEQDNNEIIKGITKFLCFDFHGPIGRSSVSGEEDIVGLTTADVAISNITSCSIQPQMAKRSVKHFKITNDDLTGKTLVHPSEHTIIAPAA